MPKHIKSVFLKEKIFSIVITVIGIAGTYFCSSPPPSPPTGANAYLMMVPGGNFIKVILDHSLSVFFAILTIYGILKILDWTLFANVLKNEKIIDRWSTLIQNEQGKMEQVYKDTEDNIKKSEAPYVKYERVKISASFLKGLFGNKRVYLKVINQKYKSYKIYVGARDYGNNLDLCWYLTYEPGLISRILEKLLPFLSSKKLVWIPKLDLFAQQDLSSYTTVVHHCFMEAVEKITKGTGQVIDRKSKGFLGIS